MSDVTAPGDGGSPGCLGAAASAAAAAYGGGGPRGGDRPPPPNPPGARKAGMVVSEGVDDQGRSKADAI